MEVTFILSFVFSLTFIKCVDLDGFEINRIEYTPLHDTIIVNDIVDIISELENSMNSQLNTHLLSNSESEEDIENLLLEYQQYLDKAHEQRLNYIRKNKGKNKVPLLRHEKISKFKPADRKSYGENVNYYYNDNGHPTVHLNNFVPQQSHIKFLNKPESLPHTLRNSYDDINLRNLPTSFPQNPSEIILSSCICKENSMPCKCPCKQCLIADSDFSRNFNKIIPLTGGIFKKSKYAQEKLNNILDNNLNLRIKIEVQLPNVSTLSSILKYNNQDRTDEIEDMIPKETLSSINLPFPYLNFPIPLELIGYNQNLYKDKSSSSHKMMAHKKKKYRLVNNKKHKNNRFYNLHNLKFEPQIHQNTTGNYKNNLINKNDSLNSHENKESLLKINHNETILNNISNNTIITPENKILSNQSNEKILLSINITNGNYSHLENVTNTENSIETDFVNENDNISTTKSLRLKRDTEEKIAKPSNITLFNNNKTITTLSPINNQSYLPNISVKDSESDNELLYWPFANKNQSLVNSKNITALILDREIKKAKLNMTKDKIRNNHTTALDKAIFGDIDWNDVDAVVPTFISFVGKYITGVLTFCSQNVCHSMKCAEKMCMHRICTPDNRYNNIGHCVGNNSTDSVATMESIMDLPSNVASEIIDILEERMIGNLFGKVTLCINSKCSAFASFKKTFKKSKCTFKELNLAGHCPNLKNVKII